MSRLVLARLDKLEANMLQLMNVTYDSEGAARYIGKSLSSLEKLCHARKIRYYKPEGGNRVFYKSDLDEYIRNYPAT